MGAEEREQLRVDPAAVVPPGFDALPDDAPEVAVVVSLTFPGMGAESQRLMEDFTRGAFQELLDVGARAVLVDSAAAQLPPPEIVANADAVLFLGGGDVDATLYGHEGPVPNSYGVDSRADHYCLALIHQTLAADQPLLAICRGSQLLNVACGGTLIPDLVPSELHKGGPGQPLFLDEEVTLQPASKVAAIFGRDRLVVRSGHHQAVGEVAPVLRVAALAHDGVVEGTEHPGRTWVVGVQWHPEDPAASAVDRRALFTEFVAQTVQRRRLGVDGTEGLDAAEGLVTSFSVS
ncbi:gamma-glutamyl-gamma-aminobutyrate hydrolase family protein [Arthrobacter humicola]|uniref:Gamma-glutamyl-gamma-aminobutyrate hydrolase family protein n=1 Tax=Arthrobacter humicola TaxID=409291 RepID=A0ABN2YYZ8_9MICC